LHDALPAVAHVFRDATKAMVAQIITTTT